MARARSTIARVSPSLSRNCTSVAPPGREPRATARPDRGRRRAPDRRWHRGADRRPVHHVTLALADQRVAVERMQRIDDLRPRSCPGPRARSRRDFARDAEHDQRRRGRQPGVALDRETRRDQRRRRRSPSRSPAPSADGRWRSSTSRAPSATEIASRRSAPSRCSRVARIARAARRRSASLPPSAANSARLSRSARRLLAPPALGERGARRASGR